MSFNADKKLEHENLAEKALRSHDFAKAFFHTAKAADFAFNLAEGSEGRLANAYLEDANELLKIAVKLKAKAKDGKNKSNAISKVSDDHDQDVAGNNTAGDETASPWQLTNRPELKLGDVAGLEEVKTALREDVILPFSHPEIYDRFNVKGGGGVLMYGPPGNGKTFIAKAIAGELDAAFFSVDASQIKDKYVGETEKNMRRLFEQARAHERSVIFFDEIDSLIQKRGAQKVNAVTQFLILTDGILNTPSDGTLLLLGATNKPWSIDPAALRPGRFAKQIYVGLPDAEARQGIIDYCLRDVPVEAAFSSETAAGQMDGFSGADIAEVCNRAKKKAILRQIESDLNEELKASDMTEITQSFTPSVSKADLVEFDNWRNQQSVD